AAERLKRRYEQLSNIDELTALNNRRFFFPEVEALLSRARRYNEALALLLIDIDHFKRVNDRYGHRVGDVVLQLVAASIQRMLRPYDVLCRYGGEEFAAVLRTGEEHALMVAERLRSSVQKLNLSHPLSSTGTFVTISVGVASVRPGADGSSALSLCASADAALYRAKNEGRNRVVVASATTPELVV
ncbi:MAG: GGDEF domain-containing protein, partial [Pleurocapsa sp. SU_196_0]|nr:GGDEF domain-containing protein [Pleurocapsa sp. SU_196_0]